MNKQLYMKLRARKDFPNLVEAAKDYAIYKGIAQRDLSLSKDARIHLPFCLLPCEFPREWFEYVYSLQESLNLVLHKIAHSKEFLEECLSSTIEADEFTRNIFDIFECVFDSQREQISLGLFRSDYLLKCDVQGRINGIKQVENNTFAAGLGGISPLLKDLYQFILEKLEWRDVCDNMPENPSCEEMAKAMISAWYMYGKESAIFLFVVEESTFNILDQRILEYKILEYEKLEVLRCTFKNLRKHLMLKDNKLYVYDKEVAVVYFRVGYAPDHYEPEDWKTRLLIEKSNAIKCPSVGLHLAGTKKVQLCLNQEGVLEKFVEPNVAEKLRKVFANQYAIDLDNGNDITLKAIENPDMFVLKPEREGGGNNLYGSDISTFLNHQTDKINSYILMERLYPPEIPNYIIRSDAIPQACLVSSELGIFGVILGNKDGILKNKVAGHLLRCKPVNVSEGGIASGTGSLSYPYLL